MIFPGFPGVLSFFQVFQVEWEPCLCVPALAGLAMNFPRTSRKSCFLVSCAQVGSEWRFRFRFLLGAASPTGHRLLPPVSHVHHALRSISHLVLASNFTIMSMVVLTLKQRMGTERGLCVLLVLLSLLLLFLPPANFCEVC